MIFNKINLVRKFAITLLVFISASSFELEANSFFLKEVKNPETKSFLSSYPKTSIVLACSGTALLTAIIVSLIYRNDFLNKGKSGINFSKKFFKKLFKNKDIILKNDQQSSNPEEVNKNNQEAEEQNENEINVNNFGQNFEDVFGELFSREDDGFKASDFFKIIAKLELIKEKEINVKDLVDKLKSVIDELHTEYGSCLRYVRPTVGDILEIFYSKLDSAAEKKQESVILEEIEIDENGKECIGNNLNVNKTGILYKFFNKIENDVKRAYEEDQALKNED